MLSFPPRVRKGQLRVGWIVAGARAGLRGLVRAPVPPGGTPLVRYRWVAEWVNRHADSGLHYELFRRWRRYDAVVLLKTVSEEHCDLVKRLGDRGVPVILDANVNYYEVSGSEHYQGMLPSADQRRWAVEITRQASAVIADSEFLKEICSRYHPNVSWIPDNVRMDLVPRYSPWQGRGQRLRLLWSGQAVKLFELLAIEDVLRKLSHWVELVLVTGDLSDLERWRAGYRERFDGLMTAVPHRLIAFRSIEQLFGVYAEGGVLIAPRFLDNSYNLGHTEWKITLGMACGRMALCSPIPSYQTVAARSGGQGIRICWAPEDWARAFDALLSGEFKVGEEEIAARNVVERYYSTEIIARQHAEFVRALV